MDQEEAGQRLRARLDELEQEERISEADCAPVALDQDSVGRLSRMDAIQLQAMALAARQRRRAEKSRIAAALARLDSDEYGDCTMCGEEIAEARLLNDPSVALCIACASRNGSGHNR